jgi:hypothetical protein
LIRTFSYAKQICLASLRHGQLRVKPLKNFFYRLIFCDRLALGETREQETNLL